MSQGFPLLYKPLIGTDEATIDDKGRVLVSKKKRERLGDDFVLGLGPQGCLVAYTQRAWVRTLEEWEKSDLMNIGRTNYARMIMGTADDELNFDAQGRFVIPQKLREMGKLKKEVILIGCGDRMEIWAVEEYAIFQEDEKYAARRVEELERAYVQMTGRLPR